MGSLGGGLGYGPEPTYHISYTERSIPRSVAIKFDLFNNVSEGTNTTGMFVNGATPTSPSIDLTSHGIDLHNGDIYRARLVYDGSVLGLTITDTNDPTKTFSTNFTVDIPSTVGGPTAYVGFTAGTGANSAIQEILNWNFSPAPYFPSGFNSTGMILNNGASVTGGNLQLTDGGGYEARSAYFNTPVNVENFTADFRFQPRPDHERRLSAQHSGVGPDHRQPHPQYPRQAVRRELRQCHRNHSRRRLQARAV